jgi:heme/copper-type cytochrome/quinol oxidase subunit 2
MCYTNIMKYTLTALAIFAFLALPTALLAQDDFGLSDSAKLGNLPVSATPPSVQEVLGAGVGSILTFVGVIFLLLMIYAGFLWMFGARGGKDAEINKSKDIMKWAVAGLTIIFLSYTIVSVVLSSVKKSAQT